MQPERPPSRLSTVWPWVRQPRGGGADMNKWVIAAVLVAVAVFMYVSIIYKMS
ncbi:MAG: hypothetical protein IH626_05710 [Rhodospirillales bacterium]|nr:hypothetical protein [Rhodospirillales bacterium]